MILRKITRADLSDLLLIEQAVSVVPWTENVFKTCFEAGYSGWCLIKHQQLIGFIIVSQTKEECHVLNLCVAREHQHQGYGYRLLAHALQFAKQEKLGIAYLEVRRTNTRAINLYKKMRFILVGERKDYYPTENGREDALIFAIDLHNMPPPSISD